MVLRFLGEGLGLEVILELKCAVAVLDGADVEFKLMLLVDVGGVDVEFLAAAAVALAILCLMTVGVWVT
jgi:hypothetical protein